MLKSSRSLVILSLLAVLAWSPADGVNGAVAAPPPPGGPHAGIQAPQSPGAASWYDGTIQYSTITNCASIIFGDPYEEEGAGAYAGFAADPNNSQPAPGQTYYVHVVVAGLGNSCSGMRAYIDLALPPSTALAISGLNKVLCYYDGSLLQASDCPQSLPASSYDPGAYEIPSSDSANAHTWPIPQGHTLEIQVPVQSSAALTNSLLQANVWMLDGNDSPWLRPTEGVYVFSSNPTVVYPSPSTITITASTAHSQVYLYAHNLTGVGTFDLGTDTNYTWTHDPITISAQSPAWLVWDDWGPPFSSSPALGLLPNTLYHWRFRYLDSHGHDTIGPDQTFRTLSDGQVVLGDGTPNLCNGSNFDSAVATAKSITFNCGALPITITVSGSQPVSTSLSIDGGNKVTLDAGGAGRHFNVTPSGALTLTAITLVNGDETSLNSCGGSIFVSGLAHLTLNDVRFFDNHTAHEGGAICIQRRGVASISGSLFLHNHAGNFGGAIGDYGSAVVSDSKFISNTAPINGGGIDSTGVLQISASTFASNTVGYRGGGVYDYLGVVTISASSFISNSGPAYGGGIGNDAGDISITGSTLSDNFTANYGGGIESAGTLTLTNSTVSGNHAQLSGGGLWITDSVASLLNDTVVSNVAGAPGGNLFVGGLTATAQLTNTLVAFGSPGNCAGAVSSHGHNLDSANTCGFSAGGDQHNTNPKIGPLHDNGGLTWTHALLAGSPAIDAGTDTGCPAADQRGIARPQDGNGDSVKTCDIGAYEALTSEVLHSLFLPFVRR